MNATALPPQPTAFVEPCREDSVGPFDEARLVDQVASIRAAAESLEGLPGLSRRQRHFLRDVAVWCGRFRVVARIPEPLPEADEQATPDPRPAFRISLQRERERQAREDPRCRYCGRRGTSIDHVVPSSRGGSNDPGNLLLACKKCNGIKGARTPAEWARDILAAVHPLTRPLATFNRPPLQSHKELSMNLMTPATERVPLFFVLDEATGDRLSVHLSRDEADLEATFYGGTSSGLVGSPLMTRAVVREREVELPSDVTT